MCQQGTVKTSSEFHLSTVNINGFRQVKFDYRKHNRLASHLRKLQIEKEKQSKAGFYQMILLQKDHLCIYSQLVLVYPKTLNPTYGTYGLVPLVFTLLLCPTLCQLFCNDKKNKLVRF